MLKQVVRCLGNGILGPVLWRLAEGCASGKELGNQKMADYFLDVAAERSIVV